MESTERIDKEGWDNFILSNNGSFLQSWEWGEFQENYGRKTHHLAGDGWAVQFLEMKLPGLNKFYWYAPRGPVMSKKIRGLEFQKVMQTFIGEVKRAAEPNVIFFRLGPEWNTGQGIEKNFRGLGFKQLFYDVEPSQTLILDISQTEDELLAGMHEKWRYNIRLAERKGVTIKDYQLPVPDDKFDAFWRLAEKTAKRQNVRHHAKEYYRKQLAIGSEIFKTILFTAEHGGEIIAANILAIFNQRATYLHGASDNDSRALMAPHLLQWEQIREAQRRGCLEYDFWGIDERKYPGVTNFKKGFGGREISYVGHWDYPMDKKWYWLYHLAQKLRR